MVYRFFDEKSTGCGIDNNNDNNHDNNNNNNNNNNNSNNNIEIKQNRRPLDLAVLQLAKELHKPIIKEFKKQKVYSVFRDNIWGADLADMQLKSKFNKRYRFLMCYIYIYIYI